MFNANLSKDLPSDLGSVKKLPENAERFVIHKNIGYKCSNSGTPSGTIRGESNNWQEVEM